MQPPLGGGLRPLDDISYFNFMILKTILDMAKPHDLESYPISWPLDSEQISNFSANLLEASGLLPMKYVWSLLVSHENMVQGASPNTEYRKTLLLTIHVR